MFCSTGKLKENLTDEAFLGFDGSLWSPIFLSNQVEDPLDKKPWSLDLEISIFKKYKLGKSRFSWQKLNIILVEDYYKNS